MSKKQSRNKPHGGHSWADREMIQQWQEWKILNRDAMMHYRPHQDRYEAVKEMMWYNPELSEGWEVREAGLLPHPLRLVDPDYNSDDAQLGNIPYIRSDLFLFNWLGREIHKGYYTETDSLFFQIAREYTKQIPDYLERVIFFMQQPEWRYITQYPCIKYLASLYEKDNNGEDYYANKRFGMYGSCRTLERVGWNETGEGIYRFECVCGATWVEEFRIYAEGRYDAIICPHQKDQWGDESRNMHTWDNLSTKQTHNIYYNILRAYWNAQYYWPGDMNDKLHEWQHAIWFMPRSHPAYFDLGGRSNTIYLDLSLRWKLKPGDKMERRSYDAKTLVLSPVQMGKLQYPWKNNLDHNLLLLDPIADRVPKALLTN